MQLTSKMKKLFLIDYSTAFWTAFGPIFFGLVGWALYAHATHKQNEEIVSNR